MKFQPRKTAGAAGKNPNCPHIPFVTSTLIYNWQTYMYVKHKDVLPLKI